MSDLASILDGMRRQIGDLTRRMNSMSRTGVVTEVDAAGGLARVQLTDTDPPMISDWIPWAEASAGANRTHNPPTPGQQVIVGSQSGNLRDAVITSSLNSTANGRPSANGDEYVVLAVGDARISAADGGGSIVISVGGTTVTISASGMAVVSSDLTHNGKNVGDDHKHDGVQTGGAQSGPPI